MSKVISFRLNSDNPREAKALIILDGWLSQGFSTRHTITEALLMLDSSKYQSFDNGTLKDLTNQIKTLLESAEIGSRHNGKNETISSKQELSDGFITSITKTAKQGVRIKSKSTCLDKNE